MTRNIAIVPKAAARPAPLSRAAFDEFILDSMHAAELASDLKAALARVEKEPRPATALAALENSLSPARIERAMTLANACSDTFDEQYCDEDEDRYRAAVSIQIGKLLGSFPNANPSDPEIYTGCMIEDVIAAAPLLPVLQEACQRLRRQLKFPPSISELFAALESARDVVSDGINALYAVRRVSERVEALREELTAKCAKQAALAGTPPEDIGPAYAAGELVAHAKFGPGTVVECDGNRLIVDFGSNGEKQVLASFVERVANCAR